MQSLQFVLFSCLLLISTKSAAQSQSSVDSPLIELRERWEYRFGDSPMDSVGAPVWAYDRASEGWREAASLTNPPGRGHEHFMWYRTNLPEVAVENPTLFLPPTWSSFEVYVGGSLVQSFGQLRPAAENKYASIKSHLVHLPQDFAGQKLAIRIYSSLPGVIGIYDLYLKVAVGSYWDISREIFSTHIDSFLLGLLFAFFGLFSIFVFLRRFKQKALFPVSFGAFAFFLGVFYASIYPIGMVFVGHDVIRYFVGHLAFFLFPVGLYAFFEHIVGNNRIVRSLWVLHLVFTAVALGLDLLGLLPIAINQNVYYNAVFIGTILIVFFLGIRAALRGNVEARIFVLGFSAFALLGLYDLMVNLGWFPFWHGLSHWGALIFILCLGYVVERRFTENHSKLQVYSQELELKSNQLAEYSQTLEQKVLARTEDLNTKNKELETALHELKEAQKQLLMKEKMASLGNLVAGVAHEVNNPIGAIHSAADVSVRCIEKIKSAVDTDGRSENTTLNRALALLEENSRVTSVASARVSRIVKSLKTFARLDEAEYQEADIHEGLDSTLALIQHELKNRIQVSKQYGAIPKVRCFPNQLNQVFMNILVNAVQAITGTGTITIRTEVQDSYVRVMIDDTGEGIPQNQREKIFDPGFTSKGVGVGTGLGLSISYNIIQKHKGRIEVGSEVGAGTTFTIILPIVPE